MSRLRSNSTPQPLASFLHLKFLEGRPPEFAARHPFAHELALAPDSVKLPDGLRTDVQREGIARYLVNNFKDGSPVHGVIHERVQDSSYIAVNANWHRSSGDGKLHLSLYIYKEDRHVDTWHAYTDRSISFTRADTDDAATATYSPSAARQDDSTTKGYTPKPSRVEEHHEERRSFRPAAEPAEDSTVKRSSRRDDRSSEEDEESDDQQLRIPPVPPSPDEARPTALPSRSSRRHPRGDALDQVRADRDAPPPERSDEDRIKGHPPMASPTISEEERQPRSSRAKSRGRQNDDEQEERQADSTRHKIIPSKPIGKSSRRHSSSRSRSPSPARSSRSHKPRDPSPEPSLSPPPPSRADRSPSPPRALRGRSSRAHLRRESSSRSRSPDPARTVKKTKERSPSAPPKQDRLSSHSRRASPTRSASPPPRQRSVSPVPSPPRRRTASRARRAVDNEEEIIKKKVREVKERVRRRSRSRSRSRSPVAKEPSRARKIVETVEDETHRRHERPRSRSRSRSRSPRRPRHYDSSPTRSERRSRSKARSRPASPVDDPNEDRSRRRSPSRSAGTRQTTHSRPPSPSPSPPPPEPERTLKHQPSWRSVRRSPFPRDDSEDDVRGNLDDPSLDIPRGGETRELASTARRGSRKPKKDESFDPEEVEQRERQKKEATAPASTAAAVSGWFKGVGEFIKAKTAGVSVEVDVEVDDQEDDERRRARREGRRKRKEAKEAEATEAEAPDSEPPRRSRRTVQSDAETEIEDKPKRSSRRPLKEESVEDRPRSSRRNEDRPASRTEEQRSSRRPLTSSRPSSPVEEDHRHRHRDPPSSRPRSRAEQVISPAQSHTSTRSRRPPSPADEPAPPPVAETARPIRQRALSISASVGAGITGLRDTVSKVVSARVDANKQQVEADRARVEDGGRRSSRSDRRIRREEDTDQEEKRDRPSRRRAESDAEPDVEEKRSQSGRRADSVAVTDGDDSDGPSRSSRRKQKPRSDSEGDTPAHRLAKVNAADNSTTISLDTLSSQQRHVLPTSPSSQHPRSVREELRLKKAAQSAARSVSTVPDLSARLHSPPSRAERILHDIERVAERVAERTDPRQRSRGHGDSQARSKARPTRGSSFEDENGPRRLPTSTSGGPSRRTAPSATSSRSPLPSDTSLRRPSSPFRHTEDTRVLPRGGPRSAGPTGSRRPFPSRDDRLPSSPIAIMPRQPFPSSPSLFHAPAAPLARPKPVRPSSAGGALSRSQPEPVSLTGRSGGQRASSARGRAYEATESDDSADDEVEGRRRATSRQAASSSRAPPSSSSSSVSRVGPQYPPTSTRRPFPDSYSALSESEPESPPAPPRAPQRFPLDAIPPPPSSFERHSPPLYEEEGTFDSDSSVDQRRRERVQSFSRSVPSFEPFSDGEGLGEELDPRGMVVSSNSEEEARLAPAPRMQRTVVSSVPAHAPRQAGVSRGRSGVGGVGRARTEVSSPSPTSEFGSAFQHFGGFGRDERRERREMYGNCRR